MKLSRPVLLVLVLGSCLSAFSFSQRSLAQSSASSTDRPKFDVASVKRNTSGGREYSNIPLRGGVLSPPTGGLFSASNMPLIAYITFAYDLPAQQFLHLREQLPTWANTDGFDIQARAEGNPTRQQMQMMMQSLLADRFQLMVRTDTKNGPVYGLVVAKPGKTGPLLRPDAEPCSTEPAAPVPGNAGPTVSAGEFPTICGFQMMQASAPGRIRAGGRGVTIGMIVGNLTGPVTGVDRPVVDETGLGGAYDFAIEFTPQISGPLPPGANFQPDPDGPTFLEALLEQLGLKLVPQTGHINVFVVDHVEEPSAN